MCNNFVKYSRDLHNDPIFKSFSYDYRHIFLTILVNAAFKPMSLNDHGVVIDIQPGQLMTTLVDLVRLCDEPTVNKSKVERALACFEKFQFSRHETRHRKTIITITLSNIYEKQKNEVETTIETKTRQDRDKIETQKKNEKNDKNKKNISYVPTPAGLRLSDILHQSILKFQSTFKAKSLDSWPRHIDDMIRLDNRTEFDIESVINWLSTSDFWKKHILSTSKLRDKFDQLQIQMGIEKKEKEIKNTSRSTLGGIEVTEYNKVW